MRADNRWKPVNAFVHPTVSMLLKYRPEVRTHFGFDEDRMGFFDVVQDVSSTISAIVTGEGRIWVGFDFYEGEGWEGYGGIGFYNPNTKQIGVLRHPALINYSAKSLMVTDSIIYIQTTGNYELSSSVGNGLVMLNRNTLLASAIVPPGTSTLWDKDDPVNVGPLYNRPISEILSDDRFVNKTVPQFASNVLEHILTVSLDSFMVETVQYEREMRDSAKSHTTIADDKVFTLVEGKKRFEELHYGDDFVMLFELYAGVVGFSLASHNHVFDLNTKKGTVIEYEDAKYIYTVKLIDFTPRKGNSGIETMTIHATVKEIR